MNTLQSGMAAAVLALAAASAQAGSYTIVDIGSFSYSYGATVTDLNNAGQVVGYSYDGYGNAAFLYSGGTMTNLRPLLNPALGTGLGMTHSYAMGINDNGQVVGYTALSDPYIGFSYSGGVMSNLGTLGAYPVAPRDVNDSGQIVESYTTNGLYNPGPGWTNLNYAIYPLAINDNGVAGGYASAFGGFAWHAALRAADGTITDLGTLGGQNSYVYELNNGGQAVGKSHTNGNAYEHGFFYSGGVMTDIGTLVTGNTGYSVAEGINASGQVVGTSGTVGPTAYTNCTSGLSHGILYSNGTLTDVNALLDQPAGWCLTSASAINDSGQIAGVGINPDGYYHAYLLTPTVPVPAAAWLFGSGLLGLAGLRRRSARS